MTWWEGAIIGYAVCWSARRAAMLIGYDGIKKNAFKDFFGRMTYDDVVKMVKAGEAELARRGPQS